MMIVTVGFALIDAAMLDSTSPHALGAASMGAVGIGLGFIFNNLNVFAQELSGLQHFDITTAQIQSTRMAGCVLGTATTGTLFSRSLARVVASTGDAALASAQAVIVHPIHMGFAINVVVVCGAVVCTRRIIGSA
ncbi:hypothetical protein [Paraburkholderia sp. BL6669N2]|uniref:hypothetical protein n=1 Tax=Paraburkholderia sp. BL6669N2 TaxID=1938807 RepID=UPI000E22C399|nr:hypothetical protein [Paraburkholderia sp. BL6669N2]